MKGKFHLLLFFTIFLILWHPYSFSNESAPGISTRILPTFFTSCTTTSIQISMTVNPDVTAWAIEDSPPEGCEVVSISGDGVWDPIHRKIKWGFYSQEKDRSLLLHYEIIPPGGPMIISPFSGRSAYDGILAQTCGNSMMLDSGLTYRNLINHILGNPILPNEKFPAADFNKDNVINICDVIILMRSSNCNKGELVQHLLGKYPLSPNKQTLFDFNNDGLIDVSDIITIIASPRCCK